MMEMVPSCVGDPTSTVPSCKAWGWGRQAHTLQHPLEHPHGWQGTAVAASAHSWSIQVFWLTAQSPHCTLWIGTELNFCLFTEAQGQSSQGMLCLTPQLGAGCCLSGSGGVTTSRMGKASGSFLAC